MGVDVVDIESLISNVGFPIAISIGLFYQLIKMNEIVRDFQANIVKNTATIERLVDTIENLDKQDISKGA